MTGKQTHNKDSAAKSPEQMSEVAVESNESPLYKLLFNSRSDGPDYRNKSQYSADPEMVALVKENEGKAAQVLGKQPVETPVIITKNPSGPTNYEYIITKMEEAGLDISVPMQKRQFSAKQWGRMIASGSDRKNHMDLLRHHGGDDCEWLAMIEHGVPTFLTTRTTYTSPFSEYDKHELVSGVFASAVAIYDERGLMSCQPSHNITNSFSNGHQLFVTKPRDALLAAIK